MEVQFSRQLIILLPNGKLYIILQEHVLTH